MKSKCQQTRIKNMTKKIIFIMAAFCSLQVRAAVQSPESDTVRCMSLYEGFELFQPLQPSYLDGVIVPVHGSGNWFVSMAGGVTAFLGTPLGCEDLFGRIKPSYSLAVGKWFTPAVGARINYSGLQFKDCMLSTQNYHHVHADLMWNLLGSRYAKQDKVRWGLSPFAGVGLVHNATNGNNPFALSYGIQGQYRFSQRVSAIVELSGMTTFQDFDGYGRVNRLGDHMLTLSAGLAFHIGKVGWKRVVDAVPYIRQNEFLTDYSNTLSEKNRQYAKSLDMDRRTLAELKKILEIEGLLDTYSHLFDVDEDSGRSTYPKNNYSGLNSLRARLRNRNWDGKSLLEGQKASDEITPTAIFGILGFVVFGLFAVMMLTSFMSSMIEDNYKQLGVLRALGASRGNLIGIYLLVAAIFVILCNIIAMPMLPVVKGFMQAKEIAEVVQGYVIFETKWYDYIIMLALSAGITFLGSIVHILTKTKATPIEMLKGKR